MSASDVYRDTEFEPKAALFYIFMVTFIIIFHFGEKETLVHNFLVDCTKWSVDANTNFFSPPLAND